MKMVPPKHAKAQSYVPLQTHLGMKSQKILIQSQEDDIPDEHFTSPTSQETVQKHSKMTSDNYQPSPFSAKQADGIMKTFSLSPDHQVMLTLDD